MNDHVARARKAPRNTDEPSQGRPIAGITIEVIERIHEPVHDGGDSTIGQIIDDHLLNMAREGKTVQSVKFEIDVEQWYAMADRIRKENN